MILQGVKWLYVSPEEAAELGSAVVTEDDGEGGRRLTAVVGFRVRFYKNCFLHIRTDRLGLRTKAHLV